MCRALGQLAELSESVSKPVPSGTAEAAVGLNQQKVSHSEEPSTQGLDLGKSCATDQNHDFTQAHTFGK